MNLYYSADQETKKLRMVQPLPGRTEKDACKAAKPIEADAQYVVQLGDSLWAPFWPDGTGMSRGILSVLHAGFVLHNIWTKAKSPADRQKFVQEGDMWAKI